MSKKSHKVQESLHFRPQSSEPLNPQQGDMYNDGENLKTYGGDKFRSLITGLPHTQNLILNGNFDFWQRGISLVGGTGNNYLPDRFYATEIGTSIYDLARSTDIPTFLQSEFASTYSYLYTVNTGHTPGATDFTSIRYTMEGYDYSPIHSKKVRLQFWVKSSIAGTFSVSFSNDATDRSYVTTYTVDTANAWEKKTIDLTLDDTGTWLFDNGRGLNIFWCLSVGATRATSTLNEWQAGFFVGATTQTNFSLTAANNIRIAQVSLFEGDYSPETNILFSRIGKNIQEELDMCQRYCEKSLNIEDAPSGSASDIRKFVDAAALGTFANPDYFKTTKRANPTVTLYNPNTAGSGSVQERTYPANAAVADRAATATAISTLNFRINMSAAPAAGNQIRYNWIADSEL